MKVKVQTKSNYRNLNDQWLEVKEIVGTRITCLVDTEEYGKQSIDFTLKECIEMNTTDKEINNLHPIFSNTLSNFGIK